MASAISEYDELYVYAMGRPVGFILQHVVDASAAQTADASTKPIKIVFGLVGLLLHIEKGYSGRQVQLVHIKLASQRKRWPTVPLPADRGDVTVADVLSAEEGPERDAAIDAWCRSIWAAYRASHKLIGDLLKEHQII